jgi:hypothetical protein
LLRVIGRISERAGNRHQSKSLEAPSWLWTSVVALVGAHEIAYLEHCRKHATNMIA